MNLDRFVAASQSSTSSGSRNVPIRIVLRAPPLRGVDFVVGIAETTPLLAAWMRAVVVDMDSVSGFLVAHSSIPWGAASATGSRIKRSSGKGL